jgi:hypothetical protein
MSILMNFVSKGRKVIADPAFETGSPMAFTSLEGPFPA